MEKIYNNEDYLKDMSASMADKLFFLKEIPVNANTVLVDFGCADGVLLELVHGIHPEVELYGIDNNPEFLDLAKERCPYAGFYTSLDQVPKKDGKEYVLVMCSVLHEVFAYLESEEAKEFTKVAFESGQYQYLCIRDFAFPKAACDMGFVKDKLEPAFENDAVLRKEAEQFTAIYGGLEDSLKNAAHFLLKYKYTDNYEREVQENYFSYDIDALMEQSCTGYECAMYFRYMLDYTKNQIQTDFGFEPEYTTHIKVIMKRK